jgi:hypothetical protein
MGRVMSVELLVGAIHVAPTHNSTLSSNRTHLPTSSSQSPEKSTD